MNRRLMLLALILTLILVIVAAAPVRASQPAQEGNALTQMLLNVSDNNVSRTMIRYGSLSDFEHALGVQIQSANDFNKLSRSQRASYLLDVSGGQIFYSPFSGLDHPDDWQHTFGIDSYKIERELIVGKSPDWYAIIQGQFDSGLVTQKLQALGYRPSGNGLLTFNSSQAATNEIGAMIGNNYNHVIISDAQITAAPSNGMIQLATTGGNSILQTPAYAALVEVMESRDLIANTTLVSAAFFGGDFLSNTLLTDDPLTASAGGALTDDEIARLRTKLKLDQEQLVPQYETAGLGYRRGTKSRFWVIALTYTNANAAQSASKILTARLKRYGSFTQSGRQLFKGWKISGKVVPAGNNISVVAITMQLPAQTDVAWTNLIVEGDLGFLAVAR